MTCKHGRPEGKCEDCIAHQIFKLAGDRRKASGIRLRRICFMAQESQVEAFNILWEGFVERWGKSHAVDHLINIMSRVEATLRATERAKDAARKSS